MARHDWNAQLPDGRWLSDLGTSARVDRIDAGRWWTLRAAVDAIARSPIAGPDTVPVVAPPFEDLNAPV